MLLIVSLVALCFLVLISCASFGVKYTAKRVCYASGHLAFVLCLFAGSASVYHDKNAIGAWLFVLATCFIAFPVLVHGGRERITHFIENKQQKLREAIANEKGRESCGCFILWGILLAVFVYSVYAFFTLH